MSWLSGLAGKAEDLLNKIDHNAAIALQKGPGPQYAVEDAVLVEVSSQRDSVIPLRSDNTNEYSEHITNTKLLPSVKSFPNLVIGGSSVAAKDSNKKNKPSSDDDELIKFLNSPKLEPRREKKSELLSSGYSSYNGSSSSPQKLLSHSQSSKIEKNKEKIGAEYIQPKKDEVAVNVPVTDLDGLSGIHDSDKSIDVISEENAFLKRELQSSEQEAHVLKKKVRESQKDIESLEDKLARMEAHMKEVQDMYSLALEDSKKIAESAISERFQAQNELERIKNEFSYSMDDKTRSLELLKTKMEAEIVAANTKTNSLQKRYDSLVEELRNERLEAERYRARAQAVLSGRDREIAELRTRNGTSEPTDNEVSDFQMLENEKELQRWEEETFRLREEVASLKSALDEGRRQWNKERDEADDEVIIERGRREAAEEETKATLEELRHTKDELAKMHQTELEMKQKMSKLRKQMEDSKERSGSRSDWGGGRVSIGETASMRDAVEDSLSARLAALTSTLVEKQVRVESLTAERNALRLQLEKTDHLYRDAIAHLGQAPSSSVPGQNDTDDVKARIPSFLLESPFDTAVARKVKRAYSSLDSIGVRVGIFLRRYPLARTLLLSYTVFLHLWVVLVLLTYTPDVH